jgi:hypothetical protein
MQLVLKLFTDAEAKDWLAVARDVAAIITAVTGGSSPAEIKAAKEHLAKAA